MVGVGGVVKRDDDQPGHIISLGSHFCLKWHLYRFLEKAVMELGGSDPFLALEDAPLETSINAALFGRMFNIGQSWVSSKRIIVIPLVLPPRGITRRQYGWASALGTHCVRDGRRLQRLYDETLQIPCFRHAGEDGMVSDFDFSKKCINSALGAVAYKMVDLAGKFEL